VPKSLVTTTVATAASDTGGVGNGVGTGVVVDVGEGMNAGEGVEMGVGVSTGVGVPAGSGAARGEQAQAMPTANSTPIKTASLADLLKSRSVSYILRSTVRYATQHRFIRLKEACVKCKLPRHSSSLAHPSWT
jgi:hypothetical protein